MKHGCDFQKKADSRELVVVLHGLGRTRRSMARLAKSLGKEGFCVSNCSYPSRTLPAEQIASIWLPKILEESNASTAHRVHFVTHSMGGIIVRLWLRENPAPANIGRVVMIAPPNKGSEIPDRMSCNSLFRLFTGKNGLRLGTSSDSLPRQLGGFPSEIELGVIAGNCSFNPLFSSWIVGPSDGKVSVESTRLAGMRDHIVVPHSHTWLSARRAVIDQVLHFLRAGEFSRK